MYSTYSVVLLMEEKKPFKAGKIGVSLTWGRPPRSAPAILTLPSDDQADFFPRFGSLQGGTRNVPRIDLRQTMQRLADQILRDKKPAPSVTGRAFCRPPARGAGLPPTAK